MTPWVKILALSCKTTYRMILNSRSVNLSRPLRPLPHRQHPGRHAGDGNRAHPHSLMMKTAHRHQRRQRLSLLRSCVWTPAPWSGALLMWFASSGPLTVHLLQGFSWIRRLTDRRCCCWTSRQCRSAWTWSWDRPSSCATTSRGSSWHFINSLPRSWRGKNMGRDCILFFENNPVKNNVFSHFDFSNTGHPLESYIYYILSDRREH